MGRGREGWGGEGRGGEGRVSEWGETGQMRHPCMHMHSLVACVLPILIHSKV